MTAKVHDIDVMLWLGLWCLTPLSTIFQLYHGSQFYWWRKPKVVYQHGSSSISGAARGGAIGSDVTGRHMTGNDVTGSNVSLVTGNMFCACPAFSRAFFLL
jgi:hypothetical protein